MDCPHVWELTNRTDRAPQVREMVAPSPHASYALRVSILNEGSLHRLLKTVAPSPRTAADPAAPQSAAAKKRTTQNATTQNATAKKRETQKTRGKGQLSLWHPPGEPLNPPENFWKNNSDGVRGFRMHLKQEADKEGQ